MCSQGAVPAAEPLVHPIEADTCPQAWLIARVSTCGQSPEMQVAELREYASRRGWEVFNEYVDHGISGSKEGRPELNRLMADAHTRRFGRSPVCFSAKMAGIKNQEHGTLASNRQRPRNWWCNNRTHQVQGDVIADWRFQGWAGGWC